MILENYFLLLISDVNSFSIRLVHNHTANRGYVEVFLGGLWGTISPNQPYSYSWDREEATVACRELGLPHSASLPVKSGMFGSTYSLTWIERTYCKGTEKSLIDCIGMGSVWRSKSLKAGVLCTDIDMVQYRLASNTSAGRVEIFLDGTWGGINKNSWNKKSASLFCKHLQKPFSRALPVVNDVYGYSLWEWLTRVRCYGTEKNFIDCPNEVTGVYGTGSAGVVCTDDADFRVRLHNSSTEGRVEVYLDGEWGGIDASSWTHSKANIVCNQIGLKGKKGLAVTNILYGVTPTLTWLKVKDSCSSDVQILSCSVEVLANRISPRIEAGVICADVNENVLEIYNGSWFGTLRFFLDNEWGTLDADSWGEEEASVACRQLGFYSRKALAVRSEHFGHLDNRVWMKDFKCTGNEQSILDCPLSINGFLDSQVKDAGLICQDRESFQVRFVENSTSQGVVEVFLAERWGTIDSAYWDNKAAKSVCRYLQKPSRFGFAVKSGIFYQGNTYQWLSRATCDGNEPTLFDCKLFVSGIMDSSQAAAVICASSPEVSLVGGNSTKSGLIELTIEGERGYIPPVGANEARVICRQLGYTTNIAYYEGSKAFLSTHARRWASSVSCIGTEESIFDCSLTIDGTFKTEQYAYLSCEDSFTLSVVDGLGHHQGTLRLSLGNLHGYIYQEKSTHWRIQEASVACRQLGFPTFKAFAYKNFGRKTGWRLISNISCSGNERGIEQCARNYGQGKLITTDFYGVICTGMEDYNVRLSDGQYDRGRVELSVGGTWGSVSTSSLWSSGKNAKVICIQLGFKSGVAITNGTYLHGAGPVWIRDLNCAGHERSIRDCSFTISGTDFYSRSSTPDVGVICLNQTVTKLTSSKNTLKSSQDYMSTTELVLKTNNSSEGNEDTTDETDRGRETIIEVVHDKTGLFVAVSVAALSIAIIIGQAICWKLRCTIVKDTEQGGYLEACHRPDSLDQNHIIQDSRSGSFSHNNNNTELIPRRDANESVGHEGASLDSESPKERSSDYVIVTEAHLPECTSTISVT